MIDRRFKCIKCGLLGVISLVVFVFIHSNAIGQQTLWDKTIGQGASSIDLNGLAVDKVKSVYATGRFNGKGDFDPSYNGKYYQNARSSGFVIKLDSNGNFSWVKTLRTLDFLADSYGSNLAIDDFSNVYVIGYYKHTCDFDPGKDSAVLTSVGGKDVFILKLDSKGNFIWVKSFGGYNNDAGINLSFDKSNDLIIACTFRDTIRLDTTSSDQLISNGGDDILILKLSKNGDFLWSKHLGSEGDDKIYSVTSDINNNIYWSGLFSDTIDLDPGIKTKIFIPSGTSDGVVQKMTSQGDVVWNKVLGGPGYCVPGSFKLMGSDIYHTGYFTDSLKVDSASVTKVLANKSRTLANTYVIIFDTLGTFKKQTSYGGWNRVNGKAIEVDEGGNIFTSGSFHYEADFSTSKYQRKLKSKGGNDGYISLLRNSFSLDWVLQQGSSASDGTNSLFLDSSRYLYASGKKGYGYITKIDKCDNSYVRKTETHCDSLISPSKKYVWKNSGIFYDTVIYRHNCVFYYTYDLTIKNSSISKITANVCDKYRSPKNTLTKSGTYLEIIKNEEGCDSFVTIDLIIRKSSFERFKWFTCDSVKSPNGKFTWSTPGFHFDTLVNKEGCDSVMIVELSIQSNTSSTYYRTCDSFTSPSGKYKWYKTGDYKDTIANSFGCDSAMSIKLKIDTSTWGNQTFYDCEEVKSPSQKFTWNETGTYYDTIKNLHGCGHFITANVNITKSKSTQHVEGCGSFVSPSKRFIWTSSGTYYDTVTNAVGCDSIIVTNLLVDKQRASVYQSKEVLVANAKDKNYQWFDCKNGFQLIPNATKRSYIAPRNGSYAVVVWDDVCTDTSQCFQVISLSVEKHPKPLVNIYPNPNRGSFKVETNGASAICLYSITNASGKLIQTGRFTSNAEINLDKASGVYFFQVTNDEGTITLPLLIDK